MAKNTALEEKYNKLFDSMNDMINEFDEEGRSEDALTVRQELENLRELKENDARLEP